MTRSGFQCSRQQLHQLQIKTVAGPRFEPTEPTACPGPLSLSNPCLARLIGEPLGCRDMHRMKGFFAAFNVETDRIHYTKRAGNGAGHCCASWISAAMGWRRGSSPLDGFGRLEAMRTADPLSCK